LVEICLARPQKFWANSDILSMNFSSIIGLVLSIVVFFGAALTSTKEYKVFLDLHAALIVFGGTIAVALVSFNGSSMLNMIMVVFKRVLQNDVDKFDSLIKEVVRVAKAYRENSNSLTDQSKTIKNHFFKEAIQLMAAGGLEGKDLDVILAKRASTHFHRYEQEAEMFKTMAKFPPAFGLLGAVMGIVAMMQGLGSADAIKSVGPALAVALVATLYGIAVANFLFLPLGEHLAKLTKMDYTLRVMVIEAVKLIRLKKHPLVIEESLKSYLLPKERAALKKAA
jgi:chemotaxis protein MotA